MVLAFLAGYGPFGIIRFRIIKASQVIEKPGAKLRKKSHLVTSMLAPAMLSKGTSTDRLQADDLAVVEIPAFKALRFDALCIDKAQIEL